VIYSGVSRDFRPASVSQRSADVRAKYRLPERFLLFLGTLEPRKNISGLIRGYDRLLTGHPELAEYELVIAGGPGWKTGGIKAAWHSARHRDRIRLIGYVDEADRAELYRLASLFIYPSFYEGFGFPPLEAMACGLPVVMSQTASLPEVAGEAALLINPYRESDIGEAISAVLLSGSLREKMKKRSLETATKFSWRTAAEKYLQIFEGLRK
jgi:glycosyltransferase involved in cell wall biosynthesis